MTPKVIKNNFKNCSGTRTLCRRGESFSPEMQTEISKEKKAIKPDIVDMHMPTSSI